MNIAYTVQPSSQPSQAEWMKEFKIGLMAPKPREGRDRALKMMELWKDKNGNVDYTHTIKNLKP